MATLDTVQVKVRPVIDYDGMPFDVLGFAVLKPGDRVLLRLNDESASQDELHGIADALRERFPDVTFSILSSSIEVVGIEHGEGA